MTYSDGGTRDERGDDRDHPGPGADTATAHAWAALGGRPDLVTKVSYARDAGDVLPARLPVRELARATVGACSLAAAELAAARGAAPDVPAVRVSEGAVATAFHSERVLRIDGRAPTNFAPLSGFWRTADSWVRTHANYPHHRARLLAALGIPDDGTRDDHAQAEALATELKSRTAHQVQEAVYAAGGLAVALAPAPDRTGHTDRPDRTGRPAPAPDRTGSAAPAPEGPGGPSGPGGPVPALPLVERHRPASAARGPRLPDAALPAAGVRVLDLTRVLAGPVAARTLALLGADVLRIDSPGLREDADTHTDTGMGKRSTLLDLGTPGDSATFERLLASADVVLSGYRPGALDRLGLAPEALMERRPGLIVAQLCAWGWNGPWAGRRGFDSLVQVGTGIASIEGEGPEGRPGALPAQALDHGTGYLVAGGVLRALTERQADGGGTHLKYSLAGTASWLMHGLRPDGDTTDPHPATADRPSGSDTPDRWLTTAESPYGTLTHALPPVSYSGSPGNWSRSVSSWGTDRPEWL
ncbi:CoA transferase [Streptomyces sp. NPDC004111]|uniref:CoA transferase n=1 Tax=Streptomyces sp. NPDC004111 TaxID=3364690 RepID=UPI00369DD742